MELYTTNPHCFTYQTEELLTELLGGIRIDGLDRMRVTMKVTVVNRKHAGYLNNLASPREAPSDQRNLSCTGFEACRAFVVSGTLQPGQPSHNQKCKPKSIRFQQNAVSASVVLWIVSASNPAR